MLHRHFTFGDRNQTGEAALAGEQIVVTIESHRRANGVADAEQPAGRIVEEGHVDFGGQPVRCLREGTELDHCSHGVLPCGNVFGVDGVEPGCEFGAHFRRTAFGKECGKTFWNVPGEFAEGG